MKTMLNLSLGLMLIAGSAGAFDFVKMYKSGEIDKIYVEEKKPEKKHQGCSKPTVTEALARIENKLVNEEIDPELYSRAAPEEKFVEEKPLKKREKAIVFNSTTADEIKAITADPEVFLASSAGGDISAVLDERQAPVVKPKRKLKLESFSRGLIREDFEFEEVIENAEVDSSSLTNQ